MQRRNFLGLGVFFGGLASLLGMKRTKLGAASGKSSCRCCCACCKSVEDCWTIQISNVVDDRECGFVIALDTDRFAS